MQRQAVEVAEEAMSKYQVEKDIAQFIKKEVRQHAGLSSHGNTLRRHFSSSTEPDTMYISSTLAQGLHGIALLEGISEVSSHTVCSDRSVLDRPQTKSNAETKHFIYFYLGHCAILLFKTQ